MGRSHLFHLQATAPQNVYPEGTRVDINQSLFPVLKEMALSFITLHPKGFREPHWHPNAHELSYCIEGRALMTIFSPGGGHDSFILEPGCLAFIPMGYLHHVQNLDDVPFKMLICFNHEQPEDLNLSSSMSVIPPHALGAVFNLKASFFEALHTSLKPVFIGEGPQESANAYPLSWQVNRFKKNIEAMLPQIQSQGGTVRLNNQYLMPALEGLTMYSLKLEVKGVREPHWHPNAHELNYLIQGRARIILLSPDGSVDDFEMSAGDMSFLPKGYFHYIENIGDEIARFAIFFNHVLPSDIGLSGCLGAYSNALLAKLFSVSPNYFDKLPKYQEDLFVVAGGG